MQPIFVERGATGYASYRANAQVLFRFVDAVPHHDQSQKAVRVMVEAVSYQYAGGGATANAWPLPERPFAVAAGDVPAPEAGPQPFDDVVGYYLWHKKGGTTPDFDTIAEWTQAYATAPQFEKPAVAAAQADRLRRDFERVDLDATYVLNVSTFLTYDIGAERFELSAFEPNTVLYLRPLGGMGVHGRAAALGSVNENAARIQMSLGNAAGYRYLPLPREQAAKMQQVYDTGRTSADVTIGMKVASVGEGNREAPGGTLVMEVESIRLEPNNRNAAVNWPFNEAIAH